MGIFAFALTFLVFYYLYLHWSWREEEIVHRALVAKMLVTLKYDHQTCESYGMEINEDTLPNDVPLKTWYTTYAAIALKEGWMKVDDSGCFKPGDVFTYGELKNILEMFYLSEDMLTFSLKHRQSDAMVSKKHWCEVYELLCVNQNRIEKVTLTINASPSTDIELKPWQIRTDDGIKIAEGISVDAYINQKVEIFQSGDQILCVVGVVSNKNVSDDDQKFREETEANADNNKEYIRVILQSNEKDYDHDKFLVTSEHNFFVQSDRSVMRYEAGDIFEIDKDELNSNQTTIVIRTENEEGELSVLSLNRSCGSPKYKGVIELQEGTNGIWIINEVPLEEYVAGVVSSEMPENYGMSALMAQAICARTYGLKAMKEGFLHYPADVDDTVSSQVYNNQKLNIPSIEAARETKGMVLKDSEGIADVFFFSTSCGHTAASEDVWYDGTQNEDQIFVTAFLSDESVAIDLKDEKEFRSFINMEIDSCYYEEDLPWFRWQVFISDRVIEERLSNILDIHIGELIRADIIERAESGVVKAISIEGDQSSCVLYGEYRIRQIFSPEKSEITQNNGNRIQGQTLLPSGFFYMDALYENQLSKGFMIFGGGYGHGCGMSQNGAMKMGELGKNYKEILACFFPDYEIVHIPVDFSSKEE